MTPRLPYPRAPLYCPDNLKYTDMDNPDRHYSI